MKYLKDRIIPIVLCLGLGYSLRFLSEHLSLTINHIIQDLFILAFVIAGFWQQKIFALILAIFTILFLCIIEIYIPLEWNNLLRGTFIAVLLCYLFAWFKKGG